MKLGEIAQLIRGVSFDGAEASPTAAPGLAPILRAGNIADRLLTDRDLVWVPETRIATYQRLRVGDIAICLSSGSSSVVGKTAIVEHEFDGAVGAFCGVIRPRSHVESKYLALWFRSPFYFAWRDGRSRGVGIQNLRMSDLAQIEVALPRFDEQRRIASRLTDQLAAFDRARLASERELLAIRALRATTISAAFGALVGIHTAPLGRIGTLADGDWILNADYATDGVRLLQVGDVGRGKLVIKSRRYITADRAQELNCTLLQPGDLLISRMAEPIGRACVLPNLGYPAITAVDVTILRAYDVIDRDFLALYMEGDEWLAAVASRASGATRPRISRKNLETLPVPVPPLIEQRHITIELRERLATIDAMADAIDTELQAIEALPAALLRRAFADVA